MEIMLNSKQQEVLLKPLNPSRVAKRSGGGKSLSYLEAWDVKAHLIRIFGFGGWSWDVLEAVMAFEEQTERGSWHVGYKVIGVLRIRDLDFATYTEAAVGFATLPSRGEAHDMAVKTAESDALKRAAINLGDQFGLSLYNNGGTAAVVRQTLASGDLDEAPVEPVNETASPIPDEEPDEVVIGFVTALRTAMSDGDVAGILAIKATISEAGLMDAVYDGKTLAKVVDLAVAHAGKVSSGKAALADISEEVSA